MLGYTEKEASPPYGLLGAPQQRQSAPLRLVGAGLGVLFGCFVLVGFTTGSLPTLLLRDSAGQLGAWDQCGGMAYTGSTKCPKDYVCSARQPGFSQCVPGWIPLWYSAWRTGDVDDDILVALAAGGKDDAKPASPGPWGQCGGAKYAGPTKCPNDYACKYRSVTLSQCIPSSIAKWIPDYPHNDEPGDKEKSDDKESKHDSDKDDKPDDDKHGSRDKDDKKDDEKGDKKDDKKDDEEGDKKDDKRDDEKGDEKDDKKGDKKGDAPSLSLLLATKSSDVGSCCYSKTGPSDCEHPGDWCSKTEAKCTDCGGTFWTAKQIDDFKHRKDEKKDGDKDDKGDEKDKDDKKDDKKDGGKDDGKKDD